MIKLFPLGGIGNVTKNMYVYEYDQELLIVDCGIGFPGYDMPGVDFLIPDARYVQDRLEQGAKIVGLVLTHGHDDHIAALPYIVPEIGEDVPIYGSPLTAEFAMNRMADNGLEKEVQYFDKGKLKLGSFELESIRVTHSIPDTRHLVIRTPDGVFYHGSDFKLDLTPIDGIPTDLQAIAKIGKEGVLCAMIDSLRIERPFPTPSEAVVGPALRREFHGVRGKVFVTLMSSNIHRIQQAIDVAHEFGRKVTFIGRSIEQNVNTCMNMGLLHFPANSKLNKRNLQDVPDEELCVIIAGSQGQPGSSLVRAVAGQHRYITVDKGDKIIFSSEPIPGSEMFVYETIDEISLRGVEVVYSDIEDDLHVSGHASSYEQMILLHLLQPQFVFPIGGQERHRVQFSLEVQKHGVNPKQIVLPKYGVQVEFSGSRMSYGEEFPLRERTVDGAEAANIVASLLDERQMLSQYGVMVVSLVEHNDVIDGYQAEIVTKGFRANEDESLHDIEALVREEIVEYLSSHDTADSDFRKGLEKHILHAIKRKMGKAPTVLVTVNGVTSTT